MFILPGLSEDASGSCPSLPWTPARFAQSVARLLHSSSSSPSSSSGSHFKPLSSISFGWRVTSTSMSLPLLHSASWAGSSNALPSLAQAHSTVQHRGLTTLISCGSLTCGLTAGPESSAGSRRLSRRRHFADASNGPYGGRPGLRKKMKLCRRWSWQLGAWQCPEPHDFIHMD